MKEHPHYYILDADGNPQVCHSLMQWGMWLEKNHRQRVLKQEQIGAFWVSTVFLGLDHNWGDGPPLLFETMVFASTPEERAEPRKPLKEWKSGDYDYLGELDTKRYSTRAEALAGHSEVVDRLKKLTAEVDNGYGSKQSRQEDQSR